jgi:hypothetical protein
MSWLGNDLGFRFGATKARLTAELIGHLLFPLRGFKILISTNVSSHLFAVVAMSQIWRLRNRACSEKTIVPYYEVPNGIAKAFAVLVPLLENCVMLNVDIAMRKGMVVWLSLPRI